MKKQKIFFIPTYIGPIKHYERLIPYLQDTYDVEFLIVRPESSQRKESVEYCKEKKYTYHIIDKGITRDIGIRIPFFTPIKKRYEHAIACRNFLKTHEAAKIISHKSSSPYDSLFREANRLGIETIVLQWSSAASIIEQDKRVNSFVQKTYLFFLKVIFALLDLFYKESRFGYKTAIPKKIGVFDKIKKEYYIGEGFDPKIIDIVGSIDFQLLYELRKRIDTDSRLRESLLEKYGLSKNKINIVVILYRFYMAPDKKYKMTIDEHVSHYYDLFKSIREVFSEEEANVLLKMHPTENRMPELYHSYKELGVQLFYGDAKTDELVCLSDLYISEPASSVNYMVLGSNTPSIFVNLSEFEFLNNRAQYFNITHIATSREGFIRKLKEFKNGTLERQYNTDDIELRSIDKTVSFIKKNI